MAFLPHNDGPDEPGIEDPAAQAAAAGLVYVSDSEPESAGSRWGRGFRYIGPDKKAVTDQAELERIARLAIPPAYTDVWICLHPQGHLQATGLDARKRKQYRYHPGWRMVRDDIKFARMAESETPCPGCVSVFEHDLRKRGLPAGKGRRRHSKSA